MNRHSDSKKDMLEKDMRDIWCIPANKTLHVYSHTWSIQFKDIQTHG